MNVEQDLIGKTITGIMASAGQSGDLRQIWLLQFSDGTHVEFVSPGAKRALRRSAGRQHSQNTAASRSHQLTLNVA